MKKLIAGLALCAALFAISGCDGVISSDDEKFDVWYLGGLSPPSNVSASASGSNSITVSWSSVSGATEYRVYRSYDGGSSYMLLATRSGLSYTENGLSPNTTYSYYVVAYNSAGESDRSYVSKTTGGSGSTPPAAPSNVSASAQSSSSITISWDPVSGATRYQVYRSSSSNGTYDNVGSDTISTSYMDNDLSPGTTYYYKVASINSAGEKGAMSTSPAIATTAQSSSSDVPPSSSTTLRFDTWTDGMISYSGQIVWYSFYASSGTTYDVQWVDYDTNNTKVDIKVSFYRNNGALIYGPQDRPSSYSFSGENGIVYLKVESFGGYSTGTYAIKYSTTP